MMKVLNFCSNEVLSFPGLSPHISVDLRDPQMWWGTAPGGCRGAGDLCAHVAGHRPLLSLCSPHEPPDTLSGSQSRGAWVPAPAHPGFPAAWASLEECLNQVIRTQWEMALCYFWIHNSRKCMKESYLSILLQSSRLFHQRFSCHGLVSYSQTQNTAEDIPSDTTFRPRLISWEWNGAKNYLSTFDQGSLQGDFSFPRKEIAHEGAGWRCSTTW